MKILSIDFDIIMGPCIDLYANGTKNLDWEHNPYLKIFQVDYQMYEILTNYIVSLCDNLDVKNIHIISSHEHLLNICPKNEELEIINIDHHHDIHYGNHHEEEKQSLSTHHINEGNWLYYLLTSDNYQVKKYSWYHNPNSEPFFGKIEQVPKFYTKNFSAVPESQLPKDIDVLVLCLSPNFIPPYTRPLFFLWLDLINQHYNTHIDFEDTSIK